MKILKCNKKTQIMLNGSNSSDLYYLTEKSRLMEKIEVKILFAIIMGTLCFVTTFGNICVIYRYRKASLVGNLFIISLACADLIVGCFVMPLAGIYAITSVWTMSIPVCQIWLAADYIASTASIFNLLTLSMDRYWSITSPLKYLGKRTKTRALIMISIAWSISILWLIPIFGWSFFFNSGVRYIPEYKCDTEYKQNIFFKISTAIFNFYFPLIAMICINIKIYLVIRKRYHSPIMKYTSSSPSISLLPRNHQEKDQNNSISTNGSNKYKLERIPSSEEELTHSKGDSNLHHFKRFKKKKLMKQTDNFELSINQGSEHSRRNSKLTDNNVLNISSTNGTLFITNKRASFDYQRSSLKTTKKSLKNKKAFSFEYPEKNGQNHNQSLETSKSGNMHSHFVFANKSLSGSVSNINNSINSNSKKGFMNKQEKAFKQLSAIVIGFTLCFLPYFIVFLIIALCEDCVSEQMYTLSVWLGYFNSTINPFLYAALSNNGNFLKKNKDKNRTIRSSSKSTKNRLSISKSNRNSELLSRRNS